MLLTLSTDHAPATDLGYLLGKHPDRVQAFDLGFGTAHVFYPEASAARCTAALLLELDPHELVRAARRRAGGRLDATGWVNDRSYVASSFLSVALSKVFGQALAGRSRERPALAATAIPLVVHIGAVPVRGGDGLLRALFEPLGYTIGVVRPTLSSAAASDGADPPEARTVGLRLEITAPLGDVLGHLYVLVPVLDDDKHYWVGDDEVAKLLRHGEGWLDAHPARDLIVRRYLKRQGGLARRATAAMDGRAELGDERDPGERAGRAAADPAARERAPRLVDLRMGAVLAALREANARSVLDLGCGEGRLIRLLAHEPQVERILGVDASPRVLARAEARLERTPATRRGNLALDLVQGALTYRDARLDGFDAACLVEVIEHLEPERLPALEDVVFAGAAPRTVIVTTPNAEYNVRYETLPAGRMRHADHRFEWDRATFRTWGARVASQHGYAVRYLPVGEVDETLGSPTQMAVFHRAPKTEAQS